MNGFDVNFTIGEGYASGRCTSNAKKRTFSSFSIFEKAIEGVVVHGEQRMDTGASDRCLFLFLYRLWRRLFSGCGCTSAFCYISSD